MRRRCTTISLATLFAGVVLVGLAAPALAQEEEEGPAVETQTTFADEDAPAVVLSEDAAQQEEAAWTFRYLVPTVLVLSGLVLAAVILSYGLRVRGRYRVVR